VSEDKDEANKTGKKKDIMCFRCKKFGHYASKWKASQNTIEWIQYVNLGQGKYREPG